MLRSLLAIIVSTIIGLTVAKFIEGGGLAVFPPPENVEMADPQSVNAAWREFPVGYRASLLIGWGLGAFAAAALALFIARRWRPIGYLAAASIGLQAMITLGGRPFSPLLWVGAAILVAGGGEAAVRILKARAQPDNSKSDQGGLFT
ncbi:MAG: hypothetical protein AAF850_08865 [Pseudomonadota bacterium]